MSHDLNDNYRPVDLEKTQVHGSNVQGPKPLQLVCLGIFSSLLAGMGLLKIRFIVVLCLLYLCMVLMLYHYLWKSHTLERGLSLLEAPHHHFSPHEEEDYDLGVNKGVVYNFRRRNGFFEDQNSSNSSTTFSAPMAYSDTSHKTNHTRSANGTLFSLSDLPPPSRCVHAFYYMWYGNPVNDGKYYHWNHPYLPHWNARVTKKHQDGRHVPPEDIGAAYYPELGCYSSKDPVIIESHMYQLRKAGVGVVSVSWYPLGDADDEGFPPDPLVPLLLDLAYVYSVKVAIHIEPYKGRSAETVRNDLEYIIERYSEHPAFFRYKKRSADSISRRLPVVYLYDSYLIQADQWADILKPDGSYSIRGTELDCIVIGLLVERKHQQAILDGGFDGFYTYFAANDFSYGSSTSNWRGLAEFARKNSLLFIPSFGPGYNDVRVRPWNQATTKSRNNGKYYREMFQAAKRSRVGGPRGKDKGMVSLTSFNEWHEGSQIESAVSKTTDRFTYADYQPNQPEFYLQLTQEIASNMQCSL